MTTEREFLPTYDVRLDRPDEWPLYPVLPVHRNDAEVGVLIGAPGYPRHAVVLLNIFDPLLRRVLAWEDCRDGAPSFITFASFTEVVADGWSMGAAPGYGLEHWRDWDRRTEPCPSCRGRGYKGLASLAVPCGECEASGTRVIR